MTNPNHLIPFNTTLIYKSFYSNLYNLLVDFCNRFYFNINFVDSEDNNPRLYYQSHIFN